MARQRRHSLRTAVRSVGVGAIATGIDFAVLATLVSGLGLGVRAMSPIALAAGLAFQFFGNKLFAFEDNRPRWGQQAAIFLLIELFAFGANLAIFDLAVRFVPLPYLLLRAATQALVYFGFCLPLWSRVFQRSSKEVAS